MRILASILLTLAIVFGLYFLYFKRLQPGGSGSAPTQAISITRVQSDLLAIAQAERIYFAQNNSYASLGELTASGTLSLARAGRDGYTYSVETTTQGFTVTARYTGQPGDPPGTHYPTLSVDQAMQIRQHE
jgi:hypothetical protein